MKSSKNKSTGNDREFLERLGVEFTTIEEARKNPEKVVYGVVTNKKITKKFALVRLFYKIFKRK